MTFTQKMEQIFAKKELAPFFAVILFEEGIVSQKNQSLF
jgi:hypothetical protein